MALTISREFPSLMACVNHIACIFRGEITIHGKDLEDSDGLGLVTAPEFLFRGESARYETTTATMQRVTADSTLTERARALVPRLSSYIEGQLREFLSLSQMDSAGFAQHYGLPTELLDLTASADVAGFFASGGECDSKGLVAVFPTESLVRSSVLIDLRNHASADRPRRQDAFAVWHKQYVDLKSDACIDQLQSQWFGYTLTKEDKVHYQGRSQLLDAHTDQVAGVLQLVIDSMVMEHGKLPDEIAHWLSKRVAAAPFVTRPYKHDPQGKPLEVELVSASYAGMKFDEESERERSYRFWSSKYLQPTGNRLSPS